MPSLWQMTTMSLAQVVGPQRLERRPEPEAITAGHEVVLEYDRVMGTKLVLVYACGIDLIARCSPPLEGGAAVDLACGPGHFTLCLAHLGLETIRGIDLSENMVETATRNAARRGLEDRVRFERGDVTRLEALAGGSCRLTTFTNAAHHLDGIDTVRSVLARMDRITEPEGLVLVLDLARLRTEKLTERYVEVVGGDYRDRGLSHFLQEFRNSMYAAYTPSEFREAVPRDSSRAWVHIVPRGLPFAQAILGFPAGRKSVFLRAAGPAMENPLIRDWLPEWRREVGEAWAAETVKDWKKMRLGLRTAAVRRLC